MAFSSFCPNPLGASSSARVPAEAGGNSVAGRNSVARENSVARRNSYVGVDTLLKCPGDLAQNSSIFTDHIVSLRSEIQSLQREIVHLKESVVKDQQELFGHYQRFYIHCDHAAKTIQQTVKVIHQEAIVPYVKSRVLDPIEIEKLFLKDSSLSINETVKQIMKNREYYVKVCSDVQIRIIEYLIEKGNLSTPEEESQIKESLTVIFSQPRWNDICKQQISALVLRFNLTDEMTGRGQKQHLEKLLRAIVGSQSKEPMDQYQHIKEVLEKGISGGGTFRKYFNDRFKTGLLYLVAGFEIREIESSLEPTLAKPADIWRRMQKFLLVTEDEEEQFFNVLSSAGIDLDTKEKREVFKILLRFNNNIQVVKDDLSAELTEMGLTLSETKVNELELFLTGNKSVEQADQWVSSCLALTRIPDTEYDTILGECVKKIQAATETIKRTNDPWRLRSFLGINSQVHLGDMTDGLIDLDSSAELAPQSPELTLCSYIAENGFRLNPSQRMTLSCLMVSQPNYISALKWVNGNFPLENDQKRQDFAAQIELTAKRYDKTVVESEYTDFYQQFDNAKRKMRRLRFRASLAQDSIVHTAPAALSRCMDSFSGFSDAEQALDDINRVNVSIESYKSQILDKKEALQSKQTMLALLKKGFDIAASAYRAKNKSFSLFHGCSGQKRVDDISKSVRTAFENENIDDLLEILKSEMKNASKSTGYIFQGKSAMRKTSFNRYLVFELLRVIKIVGAPNSDVNQQTLNTFFGGASEVHLAHHAARSKESELRDGAKSVLTLLDQLEAQCPNRLRVCSGG